MTEVADDPRAGVVRAFTEATGLNATGLRQRGRDRATATFELIVDGQTVVPIGTIKQFWNYAEFVQAIIVALGRGLPPIKAADWHNHVQAMIVHVAAVEEVEDEPFHVALAEWLSVYAQRASTDAEAARQREPYRDDGALYVHATALAGWLRRSEGEQVTRAEVLRGLRQLGAERVTVMVGSRAGRGSRSYYRVGFDALDQT